MSTESHIPLGPEVRDASRCVHVEGVPNGLQLDTLDNIVGLADRLRAAYADGDRAVGFDEYVASLIDSLLSQSGVVPGDTDESRQDYAFAQDIYWQVMQYSETDWLTAEQGKGMKRRNVVFGNILDRYSKDLALPIATVPAAPDTPTVPGGTPEQLAIAELERLATAKHEAFAAMINAPVYGSKRKKLKEAYDVAEAAYIKAVREDLEGKVAGLEAAGNDPATRKSYIEQAVTDRTNLDTDKQLAALVAVGGKRAKFLNWYANQSTAKKVAVSIGGGLAFAGIGVGLGLLAGAVGGVSGAIVGGVMMGSRFGRGYATRMSKLYKKPTHQEAFTVDSTTLGQPVGENGVVMDEFRQATAFMSRVSREQIASAEKIKKRAVIGAIGAIAIGGALGTVAHTAVEASSGHWPAGFLQHMGSSDGTTSHEAAPGGGNSGTGGGGVDPTVPQAESAPEFKVLGGDEATISKGEGWYQTFHEMGVSPKDEHRLLGKVGPHLHEKGLAYWDKSAGEWRMNMTENGKLPKSAIEYIAQSAHDNGIHTDYDDFFGQATSAVEAAPTPTVAVSHEFPTNAQHIDKGEGYYNTLGDMGVAPEHYAEVLQQAAPELYNQSAAYKMSDGLPGINMTSDQMMPTSSLEALHQAAIDSNAPDSLTVTHDGIVFDQSSEAASTTTVDNGEFLVSDFGKVYDPDAQGYYDAFKAAGVDRSNWQGVLNMAAPQLEAVKMPNGQSLAYHTAEGWHFREISGQLSPAARGVLAEVAADLKQQSLDLAV